MAEHFWLGMEIVFVSGALNGSFALPMKYRKTWRWENTWLTFTVIALLVSPWILACGFVPHLGDVYHGVSVRTILVPMTFGFFWGIAQVTFGLGIAAVGMALAFAVVAGLACLSGSLVPLAVLNPHEILQPRGVLLLVSIPILLVGLVLYGMAGRRREREQTPPAPAAGAAVMRFTTGLAICIFTGVVGSAWNLGFAFSGGILDRSTGLGAGALTSTYALWALILSAGFVPNLLYCSYLLYRNGTWPLFGTNGSAKEFMLGVAMSLLWLAGILGYGVGTTFVGRYGTSVGFTLFIAAQILTSNVLGILTGEWKGASRGTRALLNGAVAVILISVVVLNLGGLF